MIDKDVTVFICISCKGEEESPIRPGRQLFEAVTDRLRSPDYEGIEAKPVDCLAVCKRPCTIALAGNGKWTYVVGDLDRLHGADDVIAAAVSFGRSETGIVPWRERPQSFRKGIVSRIPPLGFSLEN